MLAPNIQKEHKITNIPQKFALSYTDFKPGDKTQLCKVFEARHCKSSATHTIRVLEVTKECFKQLQPCNKALLTRTLSSSIYTAQIYFHQFYRNRHEKEEEEVIRICFITILPSGLLIRQTKSDFEYKKLKYSE